MKAGSWALGGMLALAGLAAVAGLYLYRDTGWVTSPSAVVEVPTASIELPTGGTLTSWRVPIGGRVQTGKVVGGYQPLGGGSPLPLRAPATGTLLVRFARVHSTLPPGTTVAVSGRLGAERLLALVDETAVGRIAAGDPVDVRFTAYPGQTFAGRVDRIGAAVVSATSDLLSASGTFSKTVMWVPVWISFQRGDARILPGFTASVAIRIR